MTVHFESKAARGVYARAAVFLVPDVVISVVVAGALDGGVPGFFLALGCIWGAHFLLWLRTALWSWLLFWCGGRRRMVGRMLTFLEQSGFPAPAGRYINADEYLTEVASNEKLPFKVRAGATVDLRYGELLRTVGRLTAGLQFSLALEDAFEQYASSRRRVDEAADEALRNLR